MARQLLLSCVVAGVLVTAPAFAHHTGKNHAVAKVQITHAVLADGKSLAPGAYEVWISDERPVVHNGIAVSENQRVVEIAQNGTVVAREIAEVFRRGEPQAVGTTGATGARARVDLLRGGEFVRIALNDSGARYLIHLPTGSAPAR